MLGVATNVTAVAPDQCSANDIWTGAKEATAVAPNATAGTVVNPRDTATATQDIGTRRLKGNAER